MSEIILPTDDINGEVYGYGQRLRHFSELYDIPPGLFDEPDHIVFKAADPVDFSDKVKTIRLWTEGESVAFTQLDWRFLAAAQMVIPLALWEHKYVDWVEVMESRESEGQDYAGLEYAGFYYPDINYAQILLNSRSIDAQKYYDESHNWRWLNVVINEAGQEVRFSDTKLVEVVESELEDGTAKLI
jgi:hypothetical protein